MLLEKSKLFSKEYKETIQEALQVLGKKNLALIVQGVSFPSKNNENTGFGTYNSDGAKELFDFSKGVFSAIQLGPCGKTKLSDSSPYTGTVFSKNPLFINLKELTTAKWDRILSQKTLDKIIEMNPNKGTNRAAYAYASENVELAANEFYKNFKKSASKNLKKEFEAFKKENAFWLDKDSLYEALSIENNSDYWPQWKNVLDRTLFGDADKKKAEKRIKEISKKYEDTIEKYKLEQFIVQKQSNETLEYCKKIGLKLIADRQVAFSDRDNWAYQSLFLDGWCLGCPPDYFSEDGQAWGFSVVDPDKLFNKDGSLGEAGQLLKKLYTKMFKENPGGVRIDHTVGLIDPWVYKKGSLPKVEEGAGRLYSSPNHPELAKYSIARVENINKTPIEGKFVTPDDEKWIDNLSDEQVTLYGRMIEKIVIASALDAGLTKDEIIAEDLGTLTYPVVQVMKKYGLQGMKLVQFVVPTEPNHPYRCRNIVPNSWVMVGTHDNEPIRMWASKMVNKEEVNPYIKNLIEDLCSEFGNQDEVWHKMYSDEKYLAFMKLVECFASSAQNVQIFFTDFFGINEVYNVPGTSGDPNWTLRLEDDFAKLYSDKLKSEEALNLPLVMIYAMKARGWEFYKNHQELLEKLESLVNEK
ncbi:MAG: 4-alpha-glucanotransferase [Candidatus Gastranaerophilales bacterium]|nr:4-alpha-glucanotransferase [Candidatus Gastranaerophilales bacterium]